MINLDVDELQLYFGDDYVINDYIKITQPHVGGVVDYGEAQYFSMVHTFTAIPSDMKSQLWDMGLDWCEVEDFELFMMLAQTLTPDRTSILFGDLDFSKLRPFKNNQNGDIVLADKETGLVIDKMIYLRIMSYLRKLHNLKPKVEKAANKMTKKVLIEEDRQKILHAKDKPFKSYLLPLISSVKVKQGYTKDYVRNMGLYEFFDDVARMQIINNADHLLSACYAGTIDMKKINKAELNWMKEL
jgi:hypothetical protein